MPWLETGPTARRLTESGFAALSGGDLLPEELKASWAELSTDWFRLEIDEYMADGGTYRRRRFGRFLLVPSTSELRGLPHGTVFQSRSINRFAGGVHRQFAPLREETFRNACLLAFIRYDFDCFEMNKTDRLQESWEVSVHEIRIEAKGDSEFSPAPEGVHHDGHDYVGMHLVARQNVSGGGSVLYDDSNRLVHSCLLQRPGDTILADDHRVLHRVEPIRSVDPGSPAYRDMLIIDFDYRPGLS